MASDVFRSRWALLGALRAARPLPPARRSARPGVAALGQGSVGDGKRGIGRVRGLVVAGSATTAPLFGLFGSFFGVVLQRVGDVRIVFAGTPLPC